MLNIQRRFTKGSVEREEVWSVRYSAPPPASSSAATDHYTILTWILWWILHIRYSEKPVWSDLSIFAKQTTYWQMFYRQTSQFQYVNLEMILFYSQSMKMLVGAFQEVEGPSRYLLQIFITVSILELRHSNCNWPLLTTVQNVVDSVAGESMEYGRVHSRL